MVVVKGRAKWGEYCVGNFIWEICAPRKLGKMCMSGEWMVSVDLKIWVLGCGHVSDCSSRLSQKSKMIAHRGRVGVDDST